MDMARAQRREKLEKAASELKQAKEEEAELVEELKTARKELSNSTDQLAEVSANLERAKSEFQRLKKKDLELVRSWPLTWSLLPELRIAADSFLSYLTIGGHSSHLGEFQSRAGPSEGENRETGRVLPANAGGNPG